MTDSIIFLILWMLPCLIVCVFVEVDNKRRSNARLIEQGKRQRKEGSRKSDSVYARVNRQIAR